MAEKEEKKDKNKKGSAAWGYISAGAVLAISAYFLQTFSTAFGIVQEGWIWSGFYIGAAGLAILGFMSQFSRHRKLTKFFENAGLEINGQKPSVLKTEKGGDGLTYTVSMPCGMAMSDFEKKKEALEQHLRRKVSFAFEENLIIKTMLPKKNLYPYEGAECKLFED